MATIYESHGVTATATPDGNAEKQSVVDVTRVYEYTLPSGTGELVDITAHTDTSKILREPKFKSERPQMSIITDYSDDYLDAIGGIGDYVFTIPGADTSGGSATDGTFSGKFQIVNCENSDAFVAGENGLGKLTWTLEYMGASS